MRKTRKAQLTIEFFFILTLFTIVLYQLSSFQTATMLSEQAAALNQQKTVLKGIIRAIDNVCSTGVETTLKLPCIATSNGFIEYLLYTDKTLPPNPKLLRLESKTGTGGEVKAQALCDLQAFTFQTTLDADKCKQNNDAGTLCIKNAGGVIQTSAGACP